MIAAAPAHFLLFADVHMRLQNNQEVGTWRFQLQALAGDDHFSATGAEQLATRDRLELLAVLRGLEALDQPSHVTLLTSSRYVRRGFRDGLSQWQQNDWHWERFGRRVPVKNHDLWRRVANALQFHEVACRLWRTDQPQEEVREDSPASSRLHRRRIRPLRDPVEREELQLAAG